MLPPLRVLPRGGLVFIMAAEACLIASIHLNDCQYPAASKERIEIDERVLILMVFMKTSGSASCSRVVVATPACETRFGSVFMIRSHPHIGKKDIKTALFRQCLCAYRLDQGLVCSITCDTGDLDIPTRSIRGLLICASYLHTGVFLLHSGLQIR